MNQKNSNKFTNEKWETTLKRVNNETIEYFVNNNKEFYESPTKPKHKYELELNRYCMTLPEDDLEENIIVYKVTATIILN